MGPQVKRRAIGEHLEALLGSNDPPASLSPMHLLWGTPMVSLRRKGRSSGQRLQERARLTSVHCFLSCRASQSLS